MLPPEDIKLHQTFIRLAKGMLFAYEQWVRSKTPAPTVIQDPDPANHFKDPHKQLQSD
jgi:hypothetical protein